MDCNADSIQVLEGIEAVRKRPGMFVGSTQDATAIHHLLWEVVANTLDEHLAGHADRLDIFIKSRENTPTNLRIGGEMNRGKKSLDTEQALGYFLFCDKRLLGAMAMLWTTIVSIEAPSKSRFGGGGFTDGATVTVEDDGRGIPVEPFPGEETSALEKILTTYCASGTRDGHAPHVHVSPSLHGVGLFVVNALSARLDVEVHREGRRHTIAFEHGERVEPQTDRGPTTRRGTRVTFTPDFTLLPERSFDFEELRARLSELAALNPGLTVRFQEASLSAPEGLAGWIQGRGASKAILALRRTREDVRLDLALGWRDASPGEVHAWVSQGRVIEGSHIEGLWEGIRDAAQAHLGADSTRLTISQCRERLGGLIAAIHVELRDPRFGDPSRARLDDPQVREATRAIVAEGFAMALGECPWLAARVVGIA